MTSAPITADAATSKVLGVKKTFTVAGTKVTGLSKAEKKVVKVTIKNKKVTVKGLKAGKVTFKIGKKAYTVKVGATKVTATAAATTLKVNDKTTVAIKATNGAKDKLTIKTSQSSVVKIGKSSVTADKNGKTSVTLRGLAAGTSTITVKSANTGKYAKVKITVKAADVATATPSSDAPATGTPATATPATDSPVGPTAVPTSGGAVTAAPTSGGAVTAAPTATPATGSAIATASAVTASAVNAKTIAIQFNRALTDAEQKEVTTTVMNGNVEVIVTTKFADAKTLYITKADDSVYTAATYTITVSGKTVASVSNVAVQARKLASIEITNDQLISSTDDTGYFYYKIKDQYGVDYTADIPSASLKKIGSDGSTVDLNPTTGKGTVTLENLFASNSIIKTVVVSIVDPTTGTTVSKSLVCSPAAKLANFKLGAISYPTNATRYYTGSSEAAKIAVDAVDTYGNKITDATTLNSDVQLVSSDADVVATFTADENNVAYISVDTTALLTAKQVTITAVVKETGAISNFTLDIVKQAEPTKIEFGSLNKNVLALGDTAYMDITVYNQFGDVMAAKDYVNTLQVSGTAGLTSNVNVVTSGTNAGKLELAPTGTIGIATIAVTLGGKNYTTTVDVKATRVLTSVVAPKSVSLLQGVSAHALGFTFKDQYGDTIVPTTPIDDMSYDVTVTKLSGDTDGLTCNRGTGDNESELTNISVTAASNKTGVYNVKVALLCTLGILSSSCQLNSGKHLEK